ncbi:MAG: hypothetical protein U0869_09055 [Chloroflexota bacterium]
MAAADPSDPSTPPVPPAPPRDDPHALAILSAELSTLVAARGLVYNESFTRAGMFLAFLSATLVALGLVATVTGIGDQLLVIAIAVLGVDLFIGVATLGRLVSASREDIRCLQGMNRVRHAFHVVRPDLAPYFISSRHDDLRGVLSTYGPVGDSMASGLAGVLHGFTTMPAMVSVICACLAGTIAALAVLLATGSTLLAAILAAVVLAGSIGLSLRLMTRSIATMMASLEVRFPSPRG